MRVSLHSHGSLNGTQEWLQGRTRTLGSAFSFSPSALPLSLLLGTGFLGGKVTGAVAGSHKSSFKSNKRINPASPVVEQKVSRSILIGPIGLAGGNLCPRVESPRLCACGQRGLDLSEYGPSRVDAEGAEARSLRSACLTHSSPK